MKRNIFSNQYALGVAAVVVAVDDSNKLLSIRSHALLSLLLLAIIVHKLAVSIYDSKLNDFVISSFEQCARQQHRKFKEE